MKGFRGGAWKWGERPPKWVLEEFSKALHLMGKNNEQIHMFDTGAGWSFVIAISPTQNVHKASKAISDALGGHVINSEDWYGGEPPRPAVHGDLYP